MVVICVLILYQNMNLKILLNKLEVIAVAEIYEKAVKVCTTITGIMSAISSIIVTTTNDINTIIKNTSNWNWLIVIPIISLILCISGIVLLIFSKKKKGIHIVTDNNKSGSKIDILQQSFDDYINSGEATQYMKTLGDKDEQKLKINQMYESLKNLKINGEDSGELESKLYYLYIFSLLHGAKTRVWAVSMGSEWNDSEEEKEFLRMNFEVARRKIHVERIFVIEKKDLKNLINTEAVIEQIKNRGVYYKTYVVFKEDLDKKRPNLYNQLGCGFLAFDDFAIADDRFVENDIRGFIHTSKASYKDFNTKFTELRDFAIVLDSEYIKAYEKYNLAL